MQDQPQNQPDQSAPQPTPRDLELEQLNQHLREVVAAEKFPLTEAGRLWNEIVVKEINKAVTDITSNKYEKDHNGYVKRLAELQAYKQIHRMMQLAASPARKQKILEAIGDEQQ